MEPGSFSKALSLFAEHEVARESQTAAVLKADMEKLGANRDARMTAIKTWLNGTIGEELGQAAALVLPYSAKAVQAMEAIISKHSSQGAAGFRQDGREPGSPGRVSEEAYGRMSQAERWAYAKSITKINFGMVADNGFCGANIYGAACYLHQRSRPQQTVG
jgi:hypothetical protein